MSAVAEIKWRKDCFLNRINSRIAKQFHQIEPDNTKLNCLAQMRTDIQSWYITYELINSPLLVLCQIIYKAALSFETYSSHQLMVIHQSLHINKGKIINEEYSHLKNFLSQYRIVAQSPIFQCVTTLSDPPNWIRCLIQLIDGRIATGNDERIKIWATNSIKDPDVLKGHVD